MALLIEGMEIPEGMIVAHSCDNPPCCNPAHLSIQTQRQNLLDMVARGRHASKTSQRYKETRFPGPRASGERNGSARLTNQQVMDMRAMRASGVKLKDIAQAYSTTRQYAWAVVTGYSRKNG